MKNGTSKAVRIGPDAEKRRGAVHRFQASLAIILSLCFMSLLLVGAKLASDARLADITLTSEALLSPWAAVAGIFASIVLNGIFVAAETAVEMLKPLHVRFLRELNPKSADRCQEILDNQSRYANATSFGGQMCRLMMMVACFMLAPYAAQLFNWPMNYGFLALGALMVLLPVALVNLVFGELVPKSFAELQSPRIALILYRFIRASTALFALPLLLVTGVAGVFTARFGGKANFNLENQAEEEIKTIVETAEETGEIFFEEKEMLHSVFEFSDTIAREIMTPRVDLDAASIRSDPMEIVRIIQETGHSRIPLYEETDDQILGIIHAKDLLMAIVNGKAANLRTLMRPALFVPENKNLHDLLREMRHSRTEMAIVQDEYGGTAGIVTTEDIVEELVGEIIDEYDVEEPDIQESENGWLIDGKTHVDDVNKAIGSEFESPDYDTIGGFVFGLFGRQPKPGEEIYADGYRFTVTDTDGRRIAKLSVVVPDDSGATGTHSEVM